MTEICSVEGKQWQVIELTVPGKSSSMPHAQHFEDCPFCLIQGDTGMLRWENAAVLLVVSGSRHLPPFFYQASHTLFVWATLHSRAPPVRS